MIDNDKYVEITKIYNEYLKKKTELEGIKPLCYIIIKDNNIIYHIIYL